LIIGELEWDDVNVEHTARHGVSQREVEEICFGTHFDVHVGGQRYRLSGQTDSGRFLNIVVEKLGKGIFRPITAFDMAESYKARYRKRMGRQ
jgi:hypothetical protein